MIMALFIEFLHAIGFFAVLSCRRFEGFTVTPIAVQQQQKNRLQDLLLHSPYIFFKCSAMGHRLANRLRHLRERGRVRLAPVADGGMNFWVPGLIGV